MEVPPFNSYLGTEIVRRENGEAEVALELAPHHLNRRGVPHGGVISSLLDSALGAAVISAIPRSWWCATTSLSIQFLDGAASGRLTGRGRVVRRGRNVAFAEGEVVDAGGRKVAIANGSWHLWPFRPGRIEPTSRPFIVDGESGRRLRVGKILAVGRNYAGHKAEMGTPAAAEPVLFLKPASALIHDGDTVALPADAGEVHHEVELVVVIGSPGRGIAPERALEHVLGYAVGLDLTAREVQARAKRDGEPWTLAKGFDGSAPVSGFSPRDAVGDGSDLAIELRVNGEMRQRGNTGQMLAGVPELVALASRWMTLEVGDLLFTGTPAGVGPVAPGDELEASIENVGRLQVTVGSKPAEKQAISEGTDRNGGTS